MQNDAPEKVIDPVRRDKRGQSRNGCFSRDSDLPITDGHHVSRRMRRDSITTRDATFGFYLHLQIEPPLTFRNSSWTPTLALSGVLLHTHPHRWYPINCTTILVHPYQDNGIPLLPLAVSASLQYVDTVAFTPPIDRFDN